MRTRDVLILGGAAVLAAWWFTRKPTQESAVSPPTSSTSAPSPFNLFFGGNPSGGFSPLALVRDATGVITGAATTYATQQAGAKLAAAATAVGPTVQGAIASAAAPLVDIGSAWSSTLKLRTSAPATAIYSPSGTALMPAPVQRAALGGGLRLLSSLGFDAISSAVANYTQQVQNPINTQIAAAQAAAAAPSTYTPSAPAPAIRENLSQLLANKTGYFGVVLGPTGAAKYGVPEGTRIGEIQTSWTTSEAIGGGTNASSTGVVSYTAQPGANTYIDAEGVYRPIGS